MINRFRTRSVTVSVFGQQVVDSLPTADVIPTKVRSGEAGDRFRLFEARTLVKLRGEASAMWSIVVDVAGRNCRIASEKAAARQKNWPPFQKKLPAFTNRLAAASFGFSRKRLTLIAVLVPAVVPFGNSI